MTCDGDKVSGAISSLVQRLSQESEGGRKLSEKEQLVLRLNQQYPNDVGVLSAFFLNQVGGGQVGGLGAGVAHRGSEIAGALAAGCSVYGSLLCTQGP
jgi:mannose-6-phosphate isomerase